MISLLLSLPRSCPVEEERKQLGGCQPAMAQPAHRVLGHLFVSNTHSELTAVLLWVFSDASPGAALKLRVACSKEFFQQSKIIGHLSSLRVSSMLWCCNGQNPAGMVALQPSRFKLNLCTAMHLGSHCSGPRHGVQFVDCYTEQLTSAAP